MKILFFVLIGYISGSIPFGFILVRLKGADIRKLGSGNIGATNVFRFHKGLGLLVLLLDAAKAFIPTLISLKLLNFQSAVLVGGAAVLGHITTPFLGFRGGKGVASIFGAYLALTPESLLIALFIFAIVVAVFRRISLGSLTGTLGMATGIFIQNYPLFFKLITLCLVVAVYIAHRENIIRLVRGEERKFHF